MSSISKILAPQIRDGIEQLYASQLRKLFECECELHPTNSSAFSRQRPGALSDYILFFYVL